jgi:predicted TIM-barrel fold metal-dependent hydrolase
MPSKRAVARLVPYRRDASRLIGTGAMGTFVVMSQAGSMLKLWSLLTFSGVLERHPEMKVVFTEGGPGWIPFALWSADKLYLDFQNAMEPRLGELPGYYWHRQRYASFMQDPRGLEHIDHIGVN